MNAHNTVLAAAACLAVAASGLCSVAGAVVPGRNGLIAFDAEVSDSLAIFTVSPKGTALRQLTSGDEPEYDPAWSPNGRQIAYIRSGEIWLMNADGTQQHAVTTQMAATEVSWAPDGSRLLFTSERDERTGEDLWTIKPDGTAPVRLTRTTHGDSHGAWSPDGRRIAFVRESDAGYRIHTMARDGAKLRPLLPRRMNFHFSPTWSPDGKRIAFSGGGDVFVVDADGSDRRKLATGLVEYRSVPAWSPDGKRLVFADGAEFGSRQSLYTMPVDRVAKPFELPAPGSRPTADNPDWQPLQRDDAAR